MTTPRFPVSGEFALDLARSPLRDWRHGS
jgi:hypothetical protein